MVNFASTLRSAESIVQTLGLTGSNIAKGRKSELELQAAREKYFEEARQEGLQRGIEEGRSQAVSIVREETSFRIQAEVREFGSKLDSVLKDVNSAMNQWYVNAEDGITDLVIEIVKKVLNQEMQTDRSIVKSVVAAALAEVQGQQTAKIRVNPFDVAVVRAYQDDLLSAASGIKHLQIVEDPTLEGGCVVETEGVTIDASFETQLELYANQLRHAA